MAFFSPQHFLAIFFSFSCHSLFGRSEAWILSGPRCHRKFCRFWEIARHLLPKTNKQVVGRNNHLTMEKQPVEDVLYFLLKMLIFQCHVSFQGCNMWLEDDPFLMKWHKWPLFSGHVMLVFREVPLRYWHVETEHWWFLDSIRGLFWQLQNVSFLWWCTKGGWQQNT